MVSEVKYMDIKKTQPKAMTESSLNKVKITDFIEEMKAEVTRVTWTTRAELEVYTKIVVGSTLVFGMGIYLADLLIQGVLNGIGFFFHLFGG